MPNHVHVVFQESPGYGLASVVHSWKSYAAHRINGMLGLEGILWQREYYGHMIRNEIELEHVIKYVAENPLMAGLRGWRFVWCWNGATEPAATAALP
jgi:REP element-mobilizing transposase RayT